MAHSDNVAINAVCGLSFGMCLNTLNKELPSCFKYFTVKQPFHGSKHNQKKNGHLTLSLAVSDPSRSIDR